MELKAQYQNTPSTIFTEAIKDDFRLLVIKPIISDEVTLEFLGKLVDEDPTLETTVRWFMLYYMSSTSNIGLRINVNNREMIKLMILELIYELSQSGTIKYKEKPKKRTKKK
jgi:hypothetical protein